MTPDASPSKKEGQPPAAHKKALATAVRRRLKLRHLLFLLLMLSGIIPLLLGSTRMIRVNKDFLKTKEKELLTHSAQSFADDLSSSLGQRQNQLRQLGLGLLAPPGFETMSDRLDSDWGRSYLQSFLDDHPELLAFFVTDQDGLGVPWRLVAQNESVEEALTGAFHEALETGVPVYRLVILSTRDDTGVVIAVPITADGETLVSRILIRQRLVFSTDATALDKEEFFLIDAEGEFLWSNGSEQNTELALVESLLVKDFVKVPVSVTQEFELGGEQILARVVQVATTGWGVVVHKPVRHAFREVRQMITSTILSSIVLVILALGVALFAARWLSQPIQQLVQASHEIAAGHFDRRVETEGLAFEIADLAEDFNRMSDTVESYIAQLRKAAEANRELFISSIRAFAAAIDAKDPYTRGHSERVATYSRAIATYLGLPKDMQERVWISAVLHDVGKIGIEDRILKKVGVLTPEEFEQMKLHPVIGAEIVEPISALRDMIPGIRWHHEAWNGSGYPDNLKGEETPLMARIIGVADTFDAITTTRPYQNAYSTDYALQTITKLTGKRFDPKIVHAFMLAFEAGHIQVDKDKVESVAKIKITTPEAAEPARV